jgi:polysaccharide export outer membrane protein
MKMRMNKKTNPIMLQTVAAVRCRFVLVALLPLALIAAGLLAGCENQSNFAAGNSLKMPAGKTGEPAATTNESLTLREGDVLKVSFPGSPTLDTTQEIRRDGKINLPLGVGDVDAAGMTPAALEKKLEDLYAPQLSSKQVMVQVESSSFPFYVTGMVLHPGKILTDHPITVLEAVMEAGGFDYNTADLKDVTVIRRENNIMRNYKFNLKAVLNGRQTDPFYLKPDDIVYVPERFNIF